MERLKAIGFHRLVEINCRQINRSLCAQYMACFDPPTKQVSIRGKTRVIGVEHVHQLMGLPFGGKGIEVKLSEQNPTFRDFRRAYKNIKYKSLGDTLSGKLDENFEYVFVLFTLGTLLAPSASIYVSDQLSQQIHEFNKDSHKSKATKRKTVGGCVYFLMLFCLQNFAFGDKVASEHESAMAIGPTTGLRAEQCWRKKAKKEVCTTYFRLVSMLGQEMLALQDRLTESPNNQPSSSGECEEDDEKERDEEDVDKEIDEEDDEKEIEDEDNDKEIDDEDDDKEIEDENDEKEIEDEDDHIVDIDDDDDHRHDTPIVQHGLHVEPTEEYVMEEETKGKRPYDEKEQLYELCTTKSTTKDEAEEEFVEMNGWHLRRVELLCLKPRVWLNDTVMTMVAKTLVADQLENGGTVTRHIFSAHFMQKNDKGSVDLVSGSQ
ncbi:hypothetical protein K1719_001098 [Acacia pycnantha]|nr:hypothetical protein K1719_001098 [Acacia pycnantha]